MLGSDELEELSRYAAGELSPAGAARVEAQLASREELRVALARLRALDDLAIGLDPGDPLAASDEALIARAIAQAAQQEKVAPPKLPEAAFSSRRRVLMGALALAASVALVLGLRTRAPAEAQLEVLSGSAELRGAPFTPDASRVRAGDPISLGGNALAMLRDGHGRALLAANSSVTYREGGALSLESGTAVVEGARTLISRGAELKIDGLAVASTEPFQAFAQITLAANNTPEGEPMKAALNAFRMGSNQAAAGAALALWMIHGAALASQPGTAKINVPAGAVWTDADARKPALVADARAPTSSANPPVPAVVAVPRTPDESYQNLERSEVIAAFANSGGILGVCFQKHLVWFTGPNGEKGDGQQMNPPASLAFTVGLKIAAKEGRAFVTDVALSKLVPSIEAPVRDCLELTLHKLVFPLPHPGALATVVLPVRLEVQPEGGLHAWLGEGGELRILDVHAAMRALAAEPVNKSRVPGAKGAPSSIDEGGDPVSGNADAPVTIVEFTDFQCSFCKKVNDTLLSLQNIYGDKVRFVFKQNPLPLHAQAGLAAEAALAANAQGKFAEYRKLLYYGGGDSLSRDELVNYALLAGLDIVRFTADLDANRYDAQIRADQAEAKRLNVLGVPTFYINGQPIQGAQPVDKFIEVIDAELAKH